MNITIDQEAVNKHIGELIINSTIGDSITKEVNNLLKTTNANIIIRTAVQHALAEEIRKISIELFRSKENEIREIIKNQLDKELTTTFISDFIISSLNVIKEQVEKNKSYY
jgi:hypothetical protein